ncbi:FAST kinase domain-containing protein 1, mitochondrial isoform X1 [Myzus persicae]|uniref:FAST kinase domain-containing protein 1, mitochondrial isoform X1 n=2 Tax=Myzus persicae TaxID=13164 RepID=UPI000B9386BE|nr:FAST kinase domain-containing protein 1, mitochondrial isoform X1 [Myzus persicae]
MILFKRLGTNLKITNKVIHMKTRYKTINYNTVCTNFYEINPLKSVIPIQQFHRKYCFHSFRGDETDSDTEDIEQKRDIKNIILADSNDTLATKISECKSLQDIFDILRDNNNQLNWKNISMAIAMVRELQIIYYRVCMFEKNLNSYITPEDSFENILTNNDFLNLLNLMEEHYKLMNIQCLSYSLLCLHKIGVDINCTASKKLSNRLQKILMTTPIEDIEPCILSRFTVSIVSHRDLLGLYILKDIWPIVLKKLNLCETYEDIKHISICLYNLPWFLNKSIMDNFVTLVEHTLLNKPQHDDKIKCIVKVLRLVNSPYWINQNINLTRSLLLNLQGVIKHIALYDMIQLQMIIVKQSELYQLFEEIHNETSKWLSKADVDTDITVLRLLSCIVPSSSASRRKHIESLLRKQFLLNNTFSQLCIGPLFNIIRNLKTSDVQICNAYWSSVLDWLISGKPSIREHHKLLRICNRYMNFNNNMSGTYRHYKFENQMINWLNEELEQGVSAIIPSKFSKIFSFFISYPNENIGYEIPEIMVKKVLDTVGQYSVYDCYIISRGLNTAFINRKNKTSLPMFLDQYVRLCTALNKRSLEIINQEPNLSLDQLNSLYRGYNHRYNVKEPGLFYKILDGYKNFTSEHFSSRIIRELTYNLVTSDWYDADLLDKCLKYLIKNHKYLLAENVEKILTVFFLYGVNSEKFMEFLPYATEIINRDKFKMSGLNFMRASLALCYFYSLPTTIKDYLFSVEFLEKLDDELNNCYAKATYPLKVRQLLMILNRAVCIDYPEFDVPWFHTKYCEEIQSLVPKHTGSFYLDVEKRVSQLIKNKGYLKTNSFSPYGYKLDFEIIISNSKRFKKENKNEKLVLLLLNEKDLRKTDNEMRGLSKLKQRHLEILGYRVVWIKKSIWNSMFMTEPEAKLSYLKSLIWKKP